MDGAHGVRVVLLADLELNMLIDHVLLRSVMELKIVVQLGPILAVKIRVVTWDVVQLVVVMVFVEAQMEFRQSLLLGLTYVMLKQIL